MRLTLQNKICSDDSHELMPAVAITWPQYCGYYHSPMCSTIFIWFHYRYSGNEMSTNMVILDIKMLSGFVPDAKSLKDVSYECNFKLSIIHVGCWCHDEGTQLNIISSQIKIPGLVDRVEQKEDHVLVYIQEVRRIHSEEQEMVISRFVTDWLLLIIYFPSNS